MGKKEYFLIYVLRGTCLKGCIIYLICKTISWLCKPAIALHFWILLSTCDKHEMNEFSIWERGLKTYLCAWIDSGIGQRMFSHAPFLKTFSIIYRGDFNMRRFYLLCDCFHSDFAHSGKFLMHFNRYMMCEIFLKSLFHRMKEYFMVFKTKICIGLIYRRAYWWNYFQNFYKSIQLLQ